MIGAVADAIQRTLIPRSIFPATASDEAWSAKFD